MPTLRPLAAAHDDLSSPPDSARPSAPSQDFLPGDSVVAREIADYDWARSPVGAIATWPPSLRTTLSIVLGSRFPMCLVWGPELVLFHNDAFRPMLGAKEPGALGGRMPEVWSDVWDEVAPIVDSALSGRATWSEDLPLVVDRNGYPEDTWWTFSYTPVRDETGEVHGILNIVTETTAKVKNERRLMLERAQLARTFDQNPAFMAMLRGPEHRFEFVNPAYMRLVGDREVLGRPVAEALPDIAAQGYLQRLDQVRASGRAFSAESALYRMEPVDGGPAEERYVDFVFQPITDETGAVDGIFVQGVDVTERRHAHERLREREDELRALNADLERQVAERAHERARTWAVTPDLLAVLDADGLLQKTNPAWQSLLGWPEHELASRPWWSIVHPDDVDATRDAFARVRAGEPVLGFENRCRTWAGDDRQLAWVATPEGDRTYCSGRDVTEVNAAARALAATQARLRTQFETSYQLQGLVALDGTLLDANQTALDAVQARFEDVIGNLLWESPWFAGTMGAPAQVREAFLRVVDGDDVRMELALSLQGGWRVYDFSMRPIRDADGVISAVVPEAIDITARRHAEEALRQSQKLEAMGQLTGGVAHDFNNLLTPIVVALELAGDDGADRARTRRMVGAARRAVERAATLVQRLLAFARKQPLRATEVDLAHLLGDMRALIASTCEPRVRLHLDVDDDLWPAIVDPNQLEMAILNLAVNARDAMPNGGTLTIAAHNCALPGADGPAGLPPGRYVRLCVADTGTGMDVDTRTRSIEPFFTTKGVHGTGLGLSMVHGLASQLGGLLAIDSTPGEGTTMVLWLPAAATHGPQADTPKEQDVQQHSSGKGVALVVDDEDGVRMCTADVLGDMGYEVVEAASAEDALQAIADGVVPAVMVTDHLMPGMTGAELARGVRVRFPDAAIVLVSGYADLEGLDPGLRLLRKPFGQKDLVAAVGKACAAAQ